MSLKERSSVRNSIFSIVVLAVVTGAFSGVKAGDDNFETLFAGHGDIASYIYFAQDGTYFIDTELRVGIDAFRYKHFYFSVDLNEETYMGRKYRSNMVFDPNRGGWSFGFAGRWEFEKYFIEAQMHHDCFHDIGRWMSIDYSIYWNTPRVGFGTIGFLPGKKYVQPSPGGAGLVWRNKIDYQILAGFFAPRGGSWQKNHDYDFTLATDFRYQVARLGRFGFDIDSNNLLVVNTSHKLKSKHGLNFNLSIYGNSGTFMTYLGWWPEDSQSIRNRDGKTVFGIHFAF